MGVSAGPKSITDNLIFALDSGANFRGFTKYGTAGTANSNRSAVNLIDKSTIDISNTSNIVTSLTSPANQYTMYAITYPEGSYSPASRHGITPGFNNTSATKTYTHSRDLGYFVFDDDSNSWVADSYFNGERINGHVYDTYDGEPSQHQKFQDDHAAIHAAFPNATHIIIGSHAAENNDNDTDTLAILQSLGLPDSHIGVSRPEYILVGKKNKPSTQSYVRENVSGQVAHLNVLLPLDQTKGELTFDGTDDFVLTGLFSGRNPSEAPFTVEAIVKADSANGMMWVDVDGNGSNQRFYSSLNTSTRSNFGIQGSAWSSGTPIDTNYHYQAIVMDGSTARAYDNGVQVHTKSYTSYTLPNNIRIGSRSGSSYHWDGVIPVFKIYETALTAEEIKRNYNMYKKRFDI